MDTSDKDRRLDGRSTQRALRHGACGNDGGSSMAAPLSERIKHNQPKHAWVGFKQRLSKRCFLKRVLWCILRHECQHRLSNTGETISKARASELHAIFSGTNTQRVFQTTQVLQIRKVLATTNGIIACLRSNFRRRVRIKSNVLKLSTEQRVWANNFGQTCKNV